jgi:hypothetical protein
MIQVFRCESCKGLYRSPQADGTIYHHACPPLPPDKKGRELPRPDRRDENLAFNAAGRLTGLKREGKGVTCVSDKKLAEPGWISDLKRELKKREDG